MRADVTASDSDAVSIHEALGLTDAEYERICELLVRQPNHLTPIHG